MKRIPPAEAKALVDQGWTYLDVRSEVEFGQGHPAGAVNVPLLHRGPSGMTPNEKFLDVVQAAFPKDAKLVVGCQGGGRSLRAVTMMENAGYTQLVDQRAGFGGSRDGTGAITEKGWVDAGLPVESGQPSGRSYADVSKKAVR